MSEIITIHRHSAAHSVRSYLNLAPLRDINDMHTPVPTASDTSGRSSQRFAMDVQVVSGAARNRITAMGRDIYAFTAPLVVEACLRILADPPATGGAYAPAELFDAENFLSTLAPHLDITLSLDMAAVA